MPYYHKKDGGKISLWGRRCEKCGERWSIMAWFQYPPPSDMTKFIVERKEKKPTDYSKWANKLPGVGVVAGLLPNWPRWARITSVCIFVLVIVCLFLFIIRGF